MATKVKEMPELKANGGDRRSEEFQSDIHKTEKSQFGTSSKYRTRKLKRDHPEVFERMVEGEFENVAQAEVAAGTKKRSDRWNAPKDIEKLAKKIVERYGKDQVRQLKSLL